MSIKTISIILSCCFSLFLPSISEADSSDGVFLCISKTPYPAYVPSGNDNPGYTPGGNDIPPDTAHALNQVFFVPGDNSGKGYIYSPGKDHYRYMSVFKKRHEKERELGQYKYETYQKYGDKLTKAISKFENEAKKIDLKISGKDIADNAKKINDKLNAIEKRIDETYRKINTKLANLPKLTKYVSTYHHDSFDKFQTKMGTPGWEKLVEANRYHRAAQKFVAQGVDYQQEREGLLQIADIGIRVADVNYAGHDSETGDGILSSVMSVIDNVFSYSKKGISTGMTFVAGMFRGALGTPLRPWEGYENSFYYGQAAGAFVGVMGDYTAILAGFMAGLGGTALTTTGILAPAGAVSSLAGSIAATGGLKLKDFHQKQYHEALENIKFNTRTNSGTTGIRPEGGYLKGKKHGLKWTEGPSLAKALKKPQGQWGSKTDIDFAGEKALTLKPGESAWFKLPTGTRSVVHMPDGRTVPATHIWIRNNGTGTFHGYPALAP